MVKGRCNRAWREGCRVRSLTFGVLVVKGWCNRAWRGGEEED